MRLIPHQTTPSAIVAALSGLAATAALSLSGCESIQLTNPLNPNTGEYAVVAGDRVDVPDIEMGDSKTINRIIDHGRNHSQVMDILRVYTVEYGPRLTGSTRLHASQRWAVDQFNSWGLSNVELQEFGTIATRFDRGPSTVVQRRRSETRTCSSGGGRRHERAAAAAVSTDQLGLEPPTPD